ncbi:MAG: hypothetical protein L3K19_00790 [Thermoplasmata archaeon]|nr:hypothetical protein [Thermoplasmata archaeon]
MAGRLPLLAPSPGAPGAVGPGVARSLAVGPRIADTPGSFWSLDAQTSCASCISSNASVTGFLSATPFTWVRYGQMTDACNISVGLQYSADGVSSHGCGFDVYALKAWCASLTPHCHAILSLPGENNNSAEDSAIAKWIVQTVGFQPAYWSIGNEPTGWTHYGIPWAHWRSTDRVAPSSLAYALDVRAAIAAVSLVDPGARFVGIEAACSCNTGWFQDVARVDGGSISAIAFHNYPSSGSTQESAQQFFAPLASPSNVTSSVARVRAAISGLCPRCSAMPLLVNEYNAGPGWAPSNLGGSYANAVFLAASVVQALQGNVSQLTIFNLQGGSSGHLGFSLMDSRGTVGPPGLLFSRVLSHVAIGSVYGTRLSTASPGVWSVETRNSTTASVLVVNTNLTHALTLSLPIGFLPSPAGTAYWWGPSSANPRSSSGTIATSWSIPTQGLLLIDVPVLRIGPLSPPPAPSAPIVGVGTTGAGSPTVVLPMILAGGTLLGPGWVDAVTREPVSR